MVWFGNVASFNVLVATIGMWRFHWQAHVKKQCFQNFKASLNDLERLTTSHVDLIPLGKSCRYSVQCSFFFVEGEQSWHMCMKVQPLPPTSPPPTSPPLSLPFPVPKNVGFGSMKYEQSVLTYKLRHGVCMCVSNGFQHWMGELGGGLHAHVPTPFFPLEEKKTTGTLVYMYCMS